MKSNVYVQKAPNGDWLVIDGGQRDNLIAIRKSRFAARIAKRQHESGQTVKL